MEYTEHHGSFEQMIADRTLPDIVYKYREWDNDYHKAIITKREVFFSRPTDFEDPLDCKNPLRYDLLSDEDIVNWYLEDSRRMRPNDTEQQRLKWADTMAQNSLVKNPAKIKIHEEETFNQWNERFGVLSLTANPENLNMWEKYSNDHHGFCVGFDPAIMFRFLGGGGIVNYEDELPVIFPRPRMNYTEQDYLRVFYKLTRWDFEKEYRTIKFSINPLSISDRTVQIPPEAYNCIILGAKMTSDDKQSLLQSIPVELDGIKIFESVIFNGETHFIEVNPCITY